MQGKGTKLERETIISFNEDEETASIWTASEVIYRRLLKRLGREYLKEDKERHAVFEFPKSLILLPRHKRQVSDEERSEASARMRNYHEKVVRRVFPYQE